ncbi:hypothetical protein NKI51_30495 [Mesorhizobium australicum]|uniref:hypothetical protein n=1 Tax=Mesorhizobium australicum TaxID=536018 RepID=UPI003338A96D
MENRKRLIEAYGQMVEERVGMGWHPWLLTFTYKPLGGSATMIVSRMRYEIERTYATVATRVVRRPNSPSQFENLPIWICSPDYPVYKRDKGSFRDNAVNDGLHFHGIGLMPAVSRMTVSLEDHFDDYQTMYSGAHRDLFRVHVQAIEDEVAEVAGYALKGIENPRINPDDVLILPRTRSEMR